MLNNKFIAIEGVIGVGKTTLARLLQPRFAATVLLEVFEENPFLALFYEDRDRYAFQAQIFFLLSRYHQQYQTVPGALQRGTLLSDYTFAKDELFAWLNLRDDELAMYGRVHAALSEKIPRPDLIVYLRADHDVLMRRITLRDRPYERDMDPEYIRRVAAAYDNWLARLADVPVLTIETNDLDFLSRPQDLDYIEQQVQEALAKQTNGRPDMAAGQLRALQQGNMAAFQQFHQQLDQSKGFDPDLFFNFILLVEELGELATELIRIWGESKRMTDDDRPTTDTLEEVLSRHRPALRNELADLLAYLLKLANYTGIDLEQAYLEKMRLNIDRDWPPERSNPSSQLSNDNRSQG
jgi:deoxyguanosine kinase